MATTTTTALAKSDEKKDLEGVTLRFDRLREGKPKGRHVTASQVWSDHQTLKGWYDPRNRMMDMYQDMIDLKNPFGTDKEGVEEAGVKLPTNQVIFSIATFPHDIASLAMSMAATKHPQANARPAIPQHKPEMVQEYEEFCNALLDMRMEQGSDLLIDAMQALIATGWNCYYFPYNPAYKEPGRLPFDIQLLPAQTVYPMLDNQKNILWVTIERRVTGAVLLQECGMYPGVAELFDHEPDEPGKDGNNIYTTYFTTIRYYDPEYTCLLVDYRNVSEEAAGRNPELRRRKEAQAKGKQMSVLHNSRAAARDDYAGVVPHHYGCIPVHIEWCWPEVRDGTTTEYSDLDGQTGRLVGLPFLYAMYENWKDISRMLGMLHNMLLRDAQPKYVGDADPPDMSGDYVKLDGGENFDLMKTPQVSNNFMTMLKELQEAVNRSSFAPAAYGAPGAGSGIEANSQMQAGTKRQDFIVRKIERGIAGLIRGITCIMMERGAEDYDVAGAGAKYEAPYAMTYNIKKLTKSGATIPPRVDVKLRSIDALQDPQRIATAGAALKLGLIPQRDILEKILEVANPDKMLSQLWKEKVALEGRVVEPKVAKAALETEIELAPELEKLKWKREKQAGDLEEQYAKLRIAEEMNDLPAQLQQAEKEKAIQFLREQFMQEMMSRYQPPQPPAQMPPGLPGSPMPPLSGPPLPSGTPPPNLPPSLPPMMPRQASPLGMGGAPTPPGGGGMGQVAKAPGQAEQPIQPFSRMMPPGGPGRPGVDSLMVGPQGLPGQPGSMPAIQAANQAVRFPTLAMPTTGSYRNGRQRKRGRRG